MIGLVGCSNSSKPADVRQEVWDEALRLYNMINEKAKNGEMLNNSDLEKVLLFESKYSKRTNKDVTDTEDEIVHMIVQLAYLKAEMDKSIIDDIPSATPIFRDAYVQQLKLVEEKLNIKK